MGDQIYQARQRPLLRQAALAPVLAAAALLAAACGGSGGSLNSATSQPTTLAQTLSDYSACMHKHGEPAFYWKLLPPGPPPAGTLLAFHGYAADGVSADTPAFRAATNTCARRFPLGTPPTMAELHQQFLAALKAARCMRTHGFPSWPDPAVVNGRVPEYIPTGIDTGSPQYLAAQKACNP